MVGTNFCKLGIFSEETVAWVDCVGVTAEGRSDNIGNVEIAFAALGRANANALIGELNVEGLAIYGGVDGNCGNAELLTGVDNA